MMTGMQEGWGTSLVSLSSVLFLLTCYPSRYPIFRSELLNDSIRMKCT